MQQHHTRLPFYIALIGLLGFFSCSTKKVDLAFNPPIGERFTYSFEYDIDQQFMGQQTRSTIKADFAMIVKGAEGSDKIIDARFTRFAVSFPSANDSSTFGTDQPIPSAEEIKADPSKMIARIYHAIKDQSFTISINQQGGVTAVTGIDTVLQQITTAIITDLGLPDSQREMISNTAAAQLNEATIKDMMQQSFYFYPGKTVQAGDSWTKTLQLQQGFPLSINTVYTVKAITGDEITLHANSTMEATIQQGGKLSGEQTGVILVNAKTGMLINALTDQTLKGIVNDTKMMMTTKGVVKRK